MLKSKVLKVLIVASEVSPYVKSGGLGDVIGSLPAALTEAGVDARVVLPRYRSISSDYSCSYVDSFVVTLGWRNQSSSIFKIEGAPVPTYLVENDFYFGRDGLYGYGDDHERFAFFSKSAIELLSCIDFQPDIIHFNDWQTAVGCVYLRDVYARFVFFRNIKTLFTIHNLQYQGLYNRDQLSRLDFNDGYFVPDKFEFYSNISLMKGALVYADAISTVSPTYAHEIQTPAYGHSMDSTLRHFSHKLHGILNGIDTKTYNPASDPSVYVNFSADDDDFIAKKRENKARLQDQLNLPRSDAPMVAIISRLVDQKGLDLVAIVLEEMLYKGVQLVVLGTGDGRYEHLFKHYAWHAPNQVSANIFFSDDLARKIYAGADMFLMPSVFEPCGLGQIIAMRYGTVPIVRHTGGLVDTVWHYSESNKQGNGFVFNDYVASGFMWAMNQALDTYHHDRDGWNRVMENAMSCDFSWKKSARKYKQLYEKLKRLY